MTAKLDIDVTVDSNGLPSACDQDVTEETDITWQLDDASADDWVLVSIEWTSDPGSEFDTPDVSGKVNKRKIKLKDTYTTMASYNYTIWVAPIDGIGAPRKSTDPTIRNRPKDV